MGHLVDRLERARKNYEKAKQELEMTEAGLNELLEPKKEERLRQWKFQNPLVPPSEFEKLWSQGGLKGEVLLEIEREQAEQGYLAWRQRNGILNIR
jgi:hypothetical protein